MLRRWKLNSKTAFITGAARGIGLETARELVDRGARVALAGIEPDQLNAAAESLGPDAIALEADVRDRAALQLAADAARDHFGAIDIVVANAGIASYGSAGVIDPDAFETTVDINFTGVYRTAAVTLDALKASKGYFLAISSMTSYIPAAATAAYAPSKAAVEAFCVILGTELRPYGVRVGSAHPAWIESDLVKEVRADLSRFDDFKAKLPWPADSTLTPQECGRQIVDGIEHRRMRVNVPRSLGLLYWLRPLLWSPPLRWIGSRQAKEILADIDAEVQAMGRSMSARNVEIEHTDR